MNGNNCLSSKILSRREVVAEENYRERESRYGALQCCECNMDLSNRVIRAAFLAGVNMDDNNAKRFCLG